MTSNTLVLNTANAPCDLTHLCTFTYDCNCDYKLPISDYVVTTQHGTVSVVHKVVEIARKAVVAVKSVARKAGTKIRSGWNWFKSKAQSAVATVKSGLRRAWSFTTSKAAAATIAVLLGATVVKNYIRNKWNRTRTFCRNLYASAKVKGYALYIAVRTRCLSAGYWCGRKAVQLAVWTKTQWNAFCLFMQRGWIVAKPWCVRTGKVALVAAALYLIVTAGLLVCCVIVAALGVHLFERMQKIVIVRNQNEPVEHQQKSFSLQA